MSSITKSIQNEYVLLMENAFSEKYKYAFRNLELKELRRFILKEIISSPELDNQLTNLIVLLNKFWDTHAAALITEVRASKSYRLLLPIQRFGYNISNHLRSLGIYFDSIIIAHKNEIQMLEKTPVSLLYGAYKKNSHTVYTVW